MAETPVVEQAAKDQAKRADKDDKDNASSGSSGGGGSSSTTRTSSTNGSGTVVALMGITVLFSLIGNEVKALQGTPAEGNVAVAGATLTTAGRIIVGGLVATTALTLLTHAGNGGRQFAVGLALVAMATSTLVYGGPVWKALSALLGGQATANQHTTGGTSSTGTATAPATTATEGTPALQTNPFLNQ